MQPCLISERISFGFFSERLVILGRADLLRLSTACSVTSPGLWDKPSWAGSGFTRLVIELADLPGHPARAIARRHKALLESHLGDLLKRAGVKEAYRRAREISPGLRRERFP